MKLESPMPAHRAQWKKLCEPLLHTHQAGFPVTTQDQDHLLCRKTNSNPAEATSLGS